MSKAEVTIVNSGGALTASAREYLKVSVQQWSNSSTDATSPRRKDLIRDKTKAINGFLNLAGVEVPEDILGINPAMVSRWIEELRERGLAESTIYGKVSRVSAYFRWLALTKFPGLSNPVDMARPKAPEPYESESVKKLEDDDLKKLIDFSRARAETSLAGKRDHALLLFYILTGMRRQEVIGLRVCDLHRTDDRMVMHFKQKGGEWLKRNLDDPRVAKALDDYLEASGRTNLKGDDPLWTRHDLAGKPGKPLTSHAVAKNLRKLAAKAGIENFHLHMLRHSYASMAAEGGSLHEVSEALGHKDLKTTRIYVQKLGSRQDRFSKQIGDQLGLT